MARSVTQPVKNQQPCANWPNSS